MRFLSIFSGIGAPELAWCHGLGWTCVGQAEIEPAAIAVLNHQFPGVPNLGDVEKITEVDIAALGPFDLIVGGFPCQDVSAAGKRKGLKDEHGEATRSGLFFEAMRLVGYARRRSGLRWLVLENVTGIFSSNGGRDFGTVVSEILGTGFDVPRDGWGNAGAAASDEGLVEWATLDAQFFGLAQRRERVFLVADFGAWSDRGPVLLEPESMLGDPAPRRKAGQDVAGPLGGSSQSGGFRTTDLDNQGAFIPEVFKSVPTGHGGASGKSEHETLIPMIADQLVTKDGATYAHEGATFRTHNIMAFGGNNTQGPIEVATACRAKGGTGHGDFESETFIAEPIPFDTTQLTHPENRSRPEPGDPAPTLAKDGHAPSIAFSCKDYGQDMQIDIAPTLRAMNEVDGHANAGGQIAVAFKPSHYTRGKDGAPSEVYPPLSADADKGDQEALIFESRFARNGRGAPEEICPPLKAQSGETGKGDSAPLLATQWSVRRLLPVECERLQGFPDGWTAVPYRGSSMKDGPRYARLGNAIPVPAILWIGRQIEIAHRTAICDKFGVAASCG